MRPRSFAAVVVVVAVGLAVGAACATGGRGGGKADAARGQKYFMMKCNGCQPNGGQGAGPPLFGTGHAPPGPVMKSGAGGRHNVPDAEYDSLVLYLQDNMKAPATAAPTTTTPPAGGATGAPGATKMCACSCQCPADTPPGQMANCTCQCQCP
jgi:hypothetical protein